MYRNAYEELLKWNSSDRRKPLMLWGARQVGKTYLARDLFAQNEYPERCVYIDLKEDAEIRKYCAGTVKPKDIVEFISVMKNRPIQDDVLLVFDEIQECPSLITALKYFCQEMRQQPVIATGSMVRIKLQRISRKRGIGENEPFLFPIGNINQLTLYPMTFDEYLRNANSSLLNRIREAWQEKRALAPELHELALEAVYRYLLVGGMPEAVKTFLATGSYLEAREVLKELYDNYLSDMELYQASPEAVLRARKIFRVIYSELNKESKNFEPSLIEKGIRTRDLQNPLDWLEMAYVVYRSSQLKEHITQPLMEENESLFRLFLGDIGMFSYQSGVSASAFLSKDRGNTLSGIFFENFVADELTAKGHKLFYWRGRNDCEFEFIVESEGLLYPIDVKKGRGTLNSLAKFQEHNRFAAAIKVSANNYGYDRDQKLLTIPFYMISFAAEDLAKGKPIIT